MVVTKRVTLMLPLGTTAYGVAFLDRDQKLITGIPIPGGWLPASGDKLNITYKPERSK